jgi:hypothetical protein
MKKKLIGIFVCMLMIVATGITVARTLNQDEGITMQNSQTLGYNNGWGWYNPTGSWMRSDLRYLMTVHPAGLGKVSYVGQYLNDNPSLPWAGVEATDLSIIVGNNVVSGKNQYDGTSFAYAVNETYDIVYYVVYSGTMIQTGHDTLTSTFSVSYYAPDQDPFGDEYPAYGYFPDFTFEYEKVPIVT